MTVGNGQKTPETLTRLLTAVVLLPALAIVYYGGIIAVILYLLVTSLMAAEAIRVRGEDRQPAGDCCDCGCRFCLLLILPWGR